MTLAALICAYHDSDEAGQGLRAMLLLAGRTLLERQARLAAAAGAHPIVVVVDRQPPALGAALERLRADGIAITVARNAGEAAFAVPAEAALLVMADGLVADESHVVRVLDADGPVILTMPDFGADDRFERIDGQSRWAGLSVLDGSLLRHTVSLLQDWDLQSTLLRRAVQSGVRQFSVAGAQADDRLTIAHKEEHLAHAEARIVEGAAFEAREWISRYVLAPVEQGATRLLMPTPATPEWLYGAAAGMTVLASGFFLKGWLIPGLLLILAATPLDGTAERLGLLRMQGRRAFRRWRRAMPILSGAALLALGYALWEPRGWGCIVLAVATIAFLAALHGEARGRIVEGRILLAERKGMTWLLLPFAVTGLWVTGLSLLALYAGASFFWAQSRVHRTVPARDGD
ncbi:hypothetical protein IC614_02680 [Allosphingosinicella flava]|uniref:Uncharacterized protein n=1 Tax=Allosphingosinicella flava TaxID=2771430 RepID=A0A7T2GKJ2_9SPHN|nr:hypothetical protein [Sphingosinicella flava]QPQ55527.1 hypothetical protein IC614_02680 [Sphingosinicella flava]